MISIHWSGHDQQYQNVDSPHLVKKQTCLFSAKNILNSWIDDALNYFKI